MPTFFLKHWKVFAAIALLTVGYFAHQHQSKMRLDAAYAKGVSDTEKKAAAAVIIASKKNQVLTREVQAQGNAAVRHYEIKADKRVEQETVIREQAEQIIDTQANCDMSEDMLAALNNLRNQ